MKETAEKWCFVGFDQNPLRRFFRHAIVESGFHSSSPSGFQNSEDVLKRRVFFCLFLDLPYLRYLQKSKTLPQDAYLVLVVEPIDIPKALKYQADGKIHDWLDTPTDVCHVRSVLFRAHGHVSLSNELFSTKESIQNRLKHDVQLLVTGNWEKRVQTWLGKWQENDHPLLITGEKGSGKHLLSRYIHAASQRANQPWLEFTCNGSAPEDMATELFGQLSSNRQTHRHSARRGKLTAAGQGILFLDRIDQLSIPLQKKLATTLRRKKFSPIGGGDSLPFHGKLICTIQENSGGPAIGKLIHRDLYKLMKTSTLRIPPIRERGKDFEQIALGIMERIRRKYEVQSMKITKKAMDRLQACEWKGNLRELEAVLWAGTILADQGKITLRALNPILNQKENHVLDEESAMEELIENRLRALFTKFDLDHLENLYSMVLDNVEKPLLRLVLQHVGNSQTKAAKLLGMNRNTLRKKLHTFELIS